MFRSILKKIKLTVLPCPENDYRPRILTGSFIFYYLIALLILKLVVLPVLFFLPESNLFADISRSVLIDLTNKDRQEAGLTDLKEDTLLNEAAYLKAKDILALDYFDHYNPEGKSPWYWFDQSGYNYWTAGENLGIGFLDSEEIYQAWYDSPDHRYNILNPNYQEIGIAVLEGDFKGNKTQVVVQLFGSPKEKVVGLNVESGSTPEILENNQVVEENPEEREEKPEEKLEEETIQPHEEINKPIPNQGIVLGETYFEKFEPNPTQEETFYFRLLKFMIMGYDNFIQKITFYSLLFIAGFFIIVALIKFDFNHRALIFKACLFTSILIIFIFFNKDLIVKIIPHNLGIY